MKSGRGMAVALAGLAIAAAVLIIGDGGSDATRGAGFFALAAIGGVVATRRIGRWLVGAGIVLVGALVVVGHASLMAIIGGLVLAAVGVVVVSAGPSWPGMSARYDAADPHPAAAGPGTERPQDLWDALDRGEDPTLSDATPDQPPAPDSAEVSGQYAAEDEPKE